MILAPGEEYLSPSVDVHNKTGKTMEVNWKTLEYKLFARRPETMGATGEWQVVDKNLYNILTERITEILISMLPRQAVIEIDHEWEYKIELS